MKKIIKRIILGIVILLVVLAAAVFLKIKFFEKNSLTISKGSPIAKYDRDKSCILVIDIQEYTTGELSTTLNFKKNAEAVIGNVNNIIQKASKDSILVIYIQSEITDWFLNLFNGSLKKGSEGVALDKRLNVVSTYQLGKEKEDAFSNVLLDSVLIKNKINKLYVVGLDAAHCVNSTIKAAKNRGYNISVISDAIISESDSLKDKMLKEYTNNNITLLNTEDFMSITDLK